MKIKKTIATLLLVVMLFTMIVSVSAFAESEAATINEQSTDESISAMIATASVTNSIAGDLNNDGKVNMTDVVLLRRHITGGYDQTINEAAADVNCDGVSNMTDVILMRRYIVGGYGVSLMMNGIADASQYAVVLDSDYDEEVRAVKVRLGFANETSGVYTVNKFNNVEIGKNSDMLVYPGDYLNDAIVGLVFRFALGADGTVNLYRDYDHVYNKRWITDFSQVKADNYWFYDDYGTKYATDDNAIVFLIYGGADENATAEDKKQIWNYTPLSHAVCRFADLTNTLSAKTVTIYDEERKDGKAISNYGYVLSGGPTTYAIVASMPAGDSEPIIIPKVSTLAYLLNTEYIYNMDTGKFYAKARLIDSNGLIVADTSERITEILNVADISSIRDGDVLYDYSAETNSEPIGKLERGTLAAVAIVDNVIENISLVAGKNELERNFVKAGTVDGYYYATIVDVGTRFVTAYPWDGYNNTVIDTGATLLAITENADNFVTIAIDNETFIKDGEIETATKGEEIPAGGCNAIIHIQGGRISKVISLYNNY